MLSSIRRRKHFRVDFEYSAGGNVFSYQLYNERGNWLWRQLCHFDSRGLFWCVGYSRDLFRGSILYGIFIWYRNDDVELEENEAAAVSSISGSSKPGGDDMVEKKQFFLQKIKASFTVETACMFPVLMLIFVSAVYLAFFFHDKNILQSASAETVSLGSERMRLLEPLKEEELEKYFRERVRGKLLYFSGASADVSCTEKYVEIKAKAVGVRMHIQTGAKMKITVPEEQLRIIKNLKETGM